MKRIFLIFILMPFFILAQDQLDTTQNRIVVTEDVNDCVQKIYDNPDGIKLLMTTMMSDKEKMKQLHRELMNDPSFRQMMQQMRSEMGDQNMHQDMQNHDMKNRDMNEEKQNEENVLPPIETVPPTDNPPSEVPPTDNPPSEVPPTDNPPMEVPPTEVDTTGNG